MGMSFLTLVIFIWQTNLMRKQNYLSILPYLQLSTYDYAPAHSFSLSLKNHGVGPAILESVTLEYQGSEYDLRDYDNHMMQLLTRLVPGLDSIADFTYSTLDRGIAIPSNTTYTFLQIEQAPEAYKLITKTFADLTEKGLKYKIIYRSIQDERWVIHNDSEGPEKLD